MPARVGIMLSVVLTAFVLTILCPSQSSALSSSPGPSEGGACKITSGPNAGKSGTYDTKTDRTHIWCCTGAGGTGSCTECGGSPNKCSSARSAKDPGAKPPSSAGTKTGTHPIVGVSPRPSAGGRPLKDRSGGGTTLIEKSGGGQQ